MEMWKDIPGYEGIYQASKDGSEELFPSMADASRFIGRKPQYVSNVLTHGGKIIGASGAVYSVLR